MTVRFQRSLRNLWYWLTRQPRIVEVRRHCHDYDWCANTVITDYYFEDEDVVQKNWRGLLYGPPPARLLRGRGS